VGLPTFFLARNDLPSWNSSPPTPEARMAYYRSVRSCPLGTWIPNLEDPEPVISFFYQENAFLLVATDYFTKWVEAEPSKVCLPYQIRFSQTRVESFIFFIRLPSRSRSGSGTGTSSLFDMVSFHQSPNIDSTGSKGFTSEPFLAFLPWA